MMQMCKLDTIISFALIFIFRTCFQMVYFKIVYLYLKTIYLKKTLINIGLIIPSQNIQKSCLDTFTNLIDPTTSFSGISFKFF